jgi:hypothetical protein
VGPQYPEQQQSTILPEVSEIIGKWLELVLEFTGQQSMRM